MNIIENIEKEQMSKLLEGKNLPNFKPGDTLKVHTKVKEGDRERIQVYEGVCIARKNDGLNSSFTVRKISFGEGVERVFPLYSPNVAKIEVARIGKVRRAKFAFLLLKLLIKNNQNSNSKSKDILYKIFGTCKCRHVLFFTVFGR